MKCPVLKYTVARQFNELIKIEAWHANGRLAGKIWVSLDEPGVGTVTMGKTSPNLRRCGLGTQLYTRAAQEVCKEGRNLMSDWARTPAAEAFWRKQMRKRRATCVPGRGSKLAYDDEAGFKHTGEHWPCVGYKLKCPVTLLKGRR